jgi:bifunctional DNase/RNase
MAATPVEVRVQDIRLDPDAGVPVIELVEQQGRRRTLPIVVGFFEAQAIALELGGITLPRPMAHDLMKRLVQSLGAELERVEITGRDEDTYLATLHLRASGGDRVRVDSRPSDAIALAVRLRRPIVVAPDVFPRAELVDGGRAARVWGFTAQPLTPVLAEAMGAPDARGALVSDVDPAGPAHRLRRGDVVVAVDARPVRSAIELASYAERRRDESEPVRLVVRRGERTLSVRLRQPPAR